MITAAGNKERESTECLLDPAARVRKDDKSCPAHSPGLNVSPLLSAASGLGFTTKEL